MKFMNVAEIEFFDILSKLPSAIIFSRNQSPLTVRAAQHLHPCLVQRHFSAVQQYFVKAKKDIYVLILNL